MLFRLFHRLPTTCQCPNLSVPGSHLPILILTAPIASHQGDYKSESHRVNQGKFPAHNPHQWGPGTRNPTVPGSNSLWVHGKTPPCRRGFNFHLHKLTPGGTEILVAAVAGAQKFGERTVHFHSNRTALASPTPRGATYTPAH